ncbi:zinc finger CCHC domain-containing protein 9-like [Asterias rubens]|uniref:zinc finger CCHC domain-containing protein 9-like n=1 Tax=Asterias rubens TaxID=7604 RepID=UPI001454EF32|nr:zinc finger CCHC domain-containing protein 9-like [Asterias rubens]XP_033633997.1 zinc finger CCHC domain-containing protein 9-like [Asterias rubens]
MTRWARGNKGNNKRPHEASSWDELKEKTNKAKKHPRTSIKDEDNPVKRRSKKKRKQRQDEGFVEDEPSTSKGHVISDSRIEERDSRLSSSLSERLTAMAESTDPSEDDKTTLRQKDRKREERRVKRIKNKANNMVCFNCREAGHGVADCPKILLDVEQGTGICFRCGSTEHEAHKCTARVDPGQGEFPFAKCYICQETGHLSKSCPDNPRGLYPMGGGCKRCGSVEHKSLNCPDLRVEIDPEETTIPTLASTAGWSADAEYDDMIRKPTVQKPPTKKKPKFVKF